MTKILVNNRELLLIFLFPLSDLEKFKSYEVVINNLHYTIFESKSYKFYYHSLGVCTSEDIENQLKSNEFDLYLLNSYDYIFDLDYFEFTSKNTKILLVDYIGETIEDEKINSLIDLVNSRDDFYHISNRFINLNTSKVISNLSYLSLLYYYFYLYDNIHLHPTIPTVNSNADYDFISYLGDVDKRPAKKWRLDYLSKIDFKDKKIFLPNSFQNQKEIKNTISSLYEANIINHGRYNWFSLLESLNSKIKIVFETSKPTINNFGQNIFTEKTLKCLVSNQPYILFINPTLKKSLESFGFEFVGPSEPNNIINYIQEICNGDIDKWILNKQHIYDKNKLKLESMIYDFNLPHINFFNEIK